MATVKTMLEIIIVIVLGGLFMGIMDEPAYADTQNATATVNSTGVAIEMLSPVEEENAETTTEEYTTEEYTAEDDAEEIDCTYDFCPVCGDEMINDGDCCCGRDDWDYCPVCQHYNENAEVLEEVIEEPVEAVEEVVEDVETSEEVGEIGTF